MSRFNRRNLYNSGYDSCEDIENQRVMIPSGDENDYSSVDMSERVIMKIDRKEYKNELDNYRMRNSISISFLLVTFYFVSFSKLNNRNYYLNDDKLKQENLYSEFNLYVLYIAFLFVSCKLLFI